MTLATVQVRTAPSDLRAGFGTIGKPVQYRVAVAVKGEPIRPGTALEAILSFGFWLSALAIAVTYGIYPAAMVLASRLPRRTLPDQSELPTVTMVIAAFNEGTVIGEKIENTLALDYPCELLDVMVISDESTDDTDAIVSRYAERGVRLCRQSPRGGKSRGLTTFVPSACGEILVFSDANSMYRTDAVRRLVRSFADPRVGYVVGHQRYSDDEGEVSFAERLYWGLEVLVKSGETRVGSVVGGDGAIYAARARLFEPLRDDDLSDFVNPLQIVARGYRGVFEPDAVCLEDVASTYEGEFRRKTRIVNRALRAVLRVPAALNPLKVGFFSAQLVAHKLLRWFVPHFLLLLMACTVGLLIGGARGLIVVAFWAQVTFYALAALKFVPGLGASKLIYVPYYFCLANWASFIGTTRALGGRTVAVWQPERG